MESKGDFGKVGTHLGSKDDFGKVGTHLGSKDDFGKVGTHLGVKAGLTWDQKMHHLESKSAYFGLACGAKMIIWQCGASVSCIDIDMFHFDV